MRKKFLQKKGFTLIEMLVSIALFSIVITIAIGSIFTIIDSSRKSQTLTLVMNNLNFALETMTRDLKTADPQSLFNSNNTILQLRNQNDKIIRYTFDEENGEILKSVDGGSYVSIISSDVFIENFEFEVFGNSDEQPRVTIFISGYAQITERIRSDFDIQTTVSPRKLNI